MYRPHSIFQFAIEIFSFGVCSDYAHNSVVAIDLLQPQAEFQWIEEYELSS